MSEEEAPASMTQVKAAIRSRVRKHEEHMHQGLNIYPMMDMMTILLVFMVMQFATSSAAVVTESDELRLPVSVSHATLQDAVPVQISRNSILVDGEQVVELSNGRVDPSQKQGGAQGFLIMPLYRAMGRVRDVKKQIAELDPNREFTGEVQIIADQHTPYRTLSEVLYTLGQTEFGQLRFVADQTGEMGVDPN